MIESLGWLCCGVLLGGIVAFVIGFSFGAHCNAQAERRKRDVSAEIAAKAARATVEAMAQKRELEERERAIRSRVESGPIPRHDA